MSFRSFCLGACPSFTTAADLLRVAREQFAKPEVVPTVMAKR